MAVVTPRESTQLARRVLIQHVDDWQVEIDIPEGWMLAKGLTRMGDRYVNDYDLRKEGIVRWEPVSELHLREKHENGATNYYRFAEAFSCLIRPVEKVS